MSSRKNSQSQSQYKASSINEETSEQEDDYELEEEEEMSQDKVCYNIAPDNKKIASDDENKMNIKKYIEFLYNYLGEKFCFTSGAFVIHDKNANLYHLLKTGVSYNLTYHNKDKTHNKLKIRSRTKHDEESHNVDDAMYENWMCTNNKCCKNKEDEEDELTFLMKCNCPDKDKNSSRPARNVKWYQFLGTDNEKYIFMKLESWPTPHIQHTKEAIMTYVFRKPNKSCVKSRREDCGKHCSIKKDSNKIKEYQFDAFTIDGSSPAPIEEKYGRIGDEMFIPEEINEFILTNIKNKTEASIQITSDADNIQHIKSGNIETGGRRHNRTKRKRKNKKTRKTRGKHTALKKTRRTNKKSRRNRK